MEVSINNDDLKNIERAVKEGYIKGIHQKHDKNLALEGFHKDFEMIVLNGNQIEKIDIDKWFDRIEIMKEKSPGIWQAQTKCQFSLLDKTEYTAVVKTDVFKGEVLFPQTICSYTE